MLGIIGIIALLTILGLSLFVTRVATIALMYTGLSQEAARFQARSAFTGTGFTTTEAEKVVHHPVRRRIIMLLMLLRSAGIVTILLSLILSFMGAEDTGKLLRLGWLAGGITTLWLLSMSKTLDQLIKRLMRWALKEWKDLDVRDYVSLLNLSGDYVIRELQVDEDDWLAGRTLKDCQLHKEGLSVLGIHRSNGTYVGVPKGDSDIYAGDTLILYGQASDLKQLAQREKGGSGDKDHREAVGREQHRMGKQKQEEEAWKRSKRDSARSSNQ